MPPDPRIILEVESLGSIPRAVLAVGLLLWAAYGLGSAAFHYQRRFRSGLDEELVRIAVGLNLVGAIGVVLGQLRWLSGARPIWLLAGLSVLALPPIWGWWHSHKALGIRPLVNLLQRSWLCAALAIPLVVVTLGPALAYPTGWDELVYHSELPRRWLADGRPAFYPDLPYSGFPSLGEILFWLISPIEHVIAPRLLAWACWVLALVALQRLLRRSLRGPAACALTIVFALSPVVLLISANCYVESILTMQLAALLVALGRSPRREGLAMSSAPPWAIGVLVGGAAAVKLTGLALLVVPCLWCLGLAWRDLSLTRRVVQELAVCLAVAAGVALPFYVRPWLATGNPFYPYYAEWFTSDPARLEMSRYHHAMGSAFGIPGVAAYLTGPLLLAVEEKTFDGSFGWQLVGLVLLAAVAVVVAARRVPRRGPIVWAAALGLCLYSFWHLTAQQARFAVGAMLALVVLSALGLHSVRGRPRQLVLTALAAAALASLPWRTAGYYLGSWLMVLGVFSATHHVDEGTDYRYVPLVQAIAEHVSAEGKVMLLFEHRGFYVPRTCVIGTPGFQEAGFTPPESYADPRAVQSRLAALGVTHLAMTKGPAGPDWLPSWLERLEPLFRAIEVCSQEDRLRIVWESDHYYLLEVRSTP